MKKLFSMFAIMMLGLTLVACNDDEDTTDTQATTEAPVADPVSIDVSSYDDGFYFAEEENFSAYSGWKYYVIAEVKDGKIIDSTWSGYHIDGDNKDDKYDVSAAGNYGMNDDNPWSDQADATTAFAEDKEQIDISFTNAGGNTDAISNVSVKVSAYFNLLKDALDNGKIEAGTYEDGFHYVESAEDDKGGVTYYNFIVVNGNIVSTTLNYIQAEDAPADDQWIDSEGTRYISKNSAKDLYGMKARSELGLEWYEQAENISDYIVTNDTLDDIVLDDVIKDGAATGQHTTDSISQVSIKMDGFVSLWDEAETAMTPAS